MRVFTIFSGHCLQLWVQPWPLRETLWWGVWACGQWQLCSPIIHAAAATESCQASAPGQCRSSLSYEMHTGSSFPHLRHFQVRRLFVAELLWNKPFFWPGTLVCHVKKQKQTLCIFNFLLLNLFWGGVCSETLFSLLLLPLARPVDPWLWLCKCEGQLQVPLSGWQNIHKQGF